MARRVPIRAGGVDPPVKREHLFKECVTWKKEIVELWKAAGMANLGENEGKDRNIKGSSHVLKGEKGF